VRGFVIGVVVGASAFLGGILASEEMIQRSLDEEFGTELTVAQAMSRRPVRLIGFNCADHSNAMLAEHEDEFPPCETIRPLDDKAVFR
jgi:hypothetical protein